MKDTKKTSSMKKNNRADRIASTKINKGDKNKMNEKDNKNKNKQSKFYFSFNLRLFLCSLIFVISLLIFIVSITKSFSYRNAKVINYKDTQAIDYRVYLKKNDFYDEPFLGKNMIYVANLIDKININFDYLFEISNKQTIDFNYKIIGDLIISNPNGNNRYYEKEYVLLDSKKGSMKNDNTYKISQDIDIDYDYYNKLASVFKSSYGVDTSSYLKVYLQVEKNGAKSDLNINDSFQSVINIPLSEKAIEITLDTENTSSANSVMVDSKIVFNLGNIVVMICSFAIAIVSLINLIKLISLLNNKKSKYDAFVDRVLKEYDRLIVEAKVDLDFNKFNIVHIEKFEELLDVHDNLKLPIMYCNVASHQKCYFYIKRNNDIYLMKVKAVDMEAGANETNK